MGKHVERAAPRTMKPGNLPTAAAKRKQVKEEKARSTAEAEAETRQEEDRNEEDAIQDQEEDVANARRDINDDKNDRNA